MRAAYAPSTIPRLGPRSRLHLWVQSQVAVLGLGNILSIDGVPGTFVSAFALALIIAFTGPAFAGATEAKTQADCEKAGGVWDAATNTCAEKQ